MNMELSVRVINKALTSSQVLVYQSPSNLNVKNYRSAVWKTSNLAAGGAYWDFVLPLSVEVMGRVKVSSGTVTTNPIPARYGGEYQMVTRQGSEFAIEEVGDAAADGTISVVNGVRTGPREAVITKDGRPLFSSCVRPSERVSFEIERAINFAISSEYQQGDLFQAVNLTRTWKFAFGDQRALIVTIEQNPSTREIDVVATFVPSIESFQTSCDCG